MAELQSPPEPPYALPYAQLGGLPTVFPDVPVLACLLAFYCATTLYSVYLIARRIQQRQRWGIPVILFLLCGERVVSCTMRIVWAFRITDIQIAVASQIFLQAGVLLIYVINLLLAASILQASIKAQPWLDPFLKTLSAITLTSLIMVIASTIVSVYTLSNHRRNICRNIQRAAATYFVFLAVIPVGLLITTYLVRQRRRRTIDREMATLMIVTGFAAVLCILMAGFKAAVVLKAPSLLFYPAWYHSKASLYCFESVPEVLVLIVFFTMRVDISFQALKRRESDFDDGHAYSTTSQSLGHDTKYNAMPRSRGDQGTLSLEGNYLY